VIIIIILLLHDLYSAKFEDRVGGANKTHRTNLLLFRVLYQDCEQLWFGTVWYDKFISLYSAIVAKLI